MVISIDSLLIKQLRKLLNVILVISLLLDKTFEGNNSILENLSILTDIATDLDKHVQMSFFLERKSIQNNVGR